MKINSTREVSTAFNTIDRFAEFPKTIEINHNGKWIELRQIGNGLSGGQHQLAYMGDAVGMLTITYINDGVGIKVTNASFKDNSDSTIKR